MSIKFGTDGWRGIIADDFTFDNVRYCAQGASDYLINQGLADRGLVVGYDTRFSSKEFALAVAEVSSGNGVKTFLCDRPCPTPVISYNVISSNAGGAGIITASHNPPRWNGFKYKPEYAGSASPEIVELLEKYIKIAEESKSVKSLSWDKSLLSNVGDNLDPSVPYLSHIVKLVDIEAIKKAGLRIIVDPMYGAGAGYLSSLLEGGNTEIREIHSEQNPNFPGMTQPEPVEKNLVILSEEVTKSNSDVGLALDADADRFGLIDENGSYINPLQVFALLALYLLEVKGQRGALIKSITSSNMIYKLGDLFGVSVVETPVGFKYIGPTMTKEDALIGGEESGGFGFRGHIPERDGILSGLFIVDMMVKMKKKPSQLIEYLHSKVGTHYYRRYDVSFDASRRNIISEKISSISIRSIGAMGGINISRVDQLDGTRLLLEDGSWLAIRFSGTEPLLRIYSESNSNERVDILISEARNLIGV